MKFLLLLLCYAQLSLGETYGDKSLPDTIEQYSVVEAGLGGNRAVSILADAEGRRLVLKEGQGNQFKEEILADALYQAIAHALPQNRLYIPAFKIIVSKEKIQRISRYLHGTTLDFVAQTAYNQEIAAGFVVDAYMANWDIALNNRNLLLSADKVYRLDNGGALRYRAKGELKATNGYDFSSARCDLFTLRGLSCPQQQSLVSSLGGKTLYAHVDQGKIITQIKHLSQVKEAILATADLWQRRLKLENYEELRSNLITRMDSLLAYAYDAAYPVSVYQLAHPFALSIPGTSSASVLIVAQAPAAEAKGKILVLLGKRARHQWWGNLGGTADPEDTTLSDTARREVEEESMEHYSFSQKELLAAPSHDLLRGGINPDALHRMYVKTARYLDPAVLHKSLVSQQDTHALEYSEFTWLAVSDLLKLVEANLKTTNIPSNEQQYLLKGLAIHHPLMDMLRQEPVLACLQALARQKPLRAIHTLGSIGAHKLHREDPLFPGNVLDDLPYPQAEILDPRAEQLQRIYFTTTSHMDLLSELKAKNKAKAQQAKGLGGEPLPSLTATDAYLELSLQERYKKGDDQHNVFEFLRTHNVDEAKNPYEVPATSTAYFQEFSPEISPCSGTMSFSCAMLKAMDEERRWRDWFVFYHALPGVLSFYYDVFSEFRNILRLEASAGLHSLRAVDKAFSHLADVDAFIAEEMLKQNKTDFKEIHNYHGSFKNLGLSTNMYLWGNPYSKSCSTFDFFYTNKTFEAPSANLLHNFLLEFGIVNLKKYQKLEQKYFSKDNHLLQIFIAPGVVDSMVYLSGSLGKGAYERYAEHKQELLASAFLRLLRTNPGAAAKKLSGLHLNYAEEAHGEGIDRVQARIFMKPELMTDADKVQIRRYTKSAFNEAVYLSELRALVREDLRLWLTSHQPLAANTLENPSVLAQESPLPPLQKVFRHQEQAQGKQYALKGNYEELYGKFLLEDNVEGIQRILRKNPSFDLLKVIKNPLTEKGSAPEIAPLILLATAPRIADYLITAKLVAVEQLFPVVVINDNPDQLAEILAAKPDFDLWKNFSYFLIDSFGKQIHQENLLDRLSALQNPKLRSFLHAGGYIHWLETESQAQALVGLELSKTAYVFIVGSLKSPVSAGGKDKKFWTIEHDVDLRAAKNLHRIISIAHEGRMGSTKIAGRLFTPNSQKLSELELGSSVDVLDLRASSFLTSIDLGDHCSFGEVFFPAGVSEISGIYAEIAAANFSELAQLTELRINVSLPVFDLHRAKSLDTLIIFPPKKLSKQKILILPESLRSLGQEFEAKMSVQYLPD